jgi:Rubrerythrin
MEFKESNTYKNLLVAYQANLMNSTRYNIYADIARREGFMEIGNIYDTTALNDQEHARIWLRQIDQGQLPNTQQTLLESSKNEINMASNMYQQFATVAKEEGYLDIAALFSGVANIDYNHASVFDAEYQNVKNNQVFCKPAETLWICMQCGNILSGSCAPEICPVCKFPQGYYKLLTCG